MKSSETLTFENNSSESEIKSLSIHINGIQSSIIINYANGESMLCNFSSLPELLNLSAFNPTMHIDGSEKIVENLNGLLNKDANGLIGFNGKNLMELYRETDVNNSEIRSEISDMPGLPWYKFPSNISLIVESADEFLASHENSRIFSLGQSPAWLVKAMQLLDTSKECGFIPFSGQLTTCQMDSEDEDEMDETLTFKLSEHTHTSLTDVMLEKYHGLLERLQLSPEIIINKFINFGQPTYILDFAHTGAGLASFVYVLFGWAKSTESFDVFEKACNIMVLDDYVIESNRRKTISIEDISVNCSRFVINNTEGCSLIWNLANGLDKGDKSDRLVPHYPWNLWADDPIPIEDNANHIEYITGLLRDAVSDFNAPTSTLGEATEYY